MTEKKLREILGSDGAGWEGDNALQGLLIIQNYFPGKTVLEGADHDIIYSVDVDKILKAGITIEDAIRLRDLNWMVDDNSDCLACYV